MNIFGGIIFGLGILVLASVAGASDFYEECRAAADCVAGEEPSTFWAVIKSFIGLMLMGLGVLVLTSED